MSRSKTTRLPDDLADWLEAYAVEREASEATLMVTAVENLRDDARRGVPELREKAKRQAAVRTAEEKGVGDCPKRPDGFGHVWKPDEDHQTWCRFCGYSGRRFLLEYGRERAELFSKLRQPDSVKNWKGAGRDDAA